MFKKILKEITITLLIIYFILFTLELIKEGFVSNHFDLNIILVIIIVSGILLLIISLLGKNLE